MYSYKGYVVKEMQSGKKLCDRSFPLVRGVFGGTEKCRAATDLTVQLSY